MPCVARADEDNPNDEEPRAASGNPSAKHHFDEALAHYREGHYRAAIAELKAALTFDPTSKDLVYNLALVHEKLGELDLAIAGEDFAGDHDDCSRTSAAVSPPVA